jgi:Predicted periplasmic solute-binding protein
LPAGPICNPGTAALNAAIHPAQTKYLYFVSDKTGKTYYAETYEQQQANCALAGVTPGEANTPSVQ